MAEPLNSPDIERALQSLGVVSAPEDVRTGAPVNSPELLLGQAGVPSLDLRSLEQPVWQELTTPASVERPKSGNDHRARLADLLAFTAMPQTLAKYWRDDYRVHKLLTSLLGEPGPELYAHVIAELPYISFLGNYATRACFTAQFGVQSLSVGMWDNGEPYADKAAIREFWSKDYIRLGHQRGGRPAVVFQDVASYSPYLVPASVVLPAVRDMFGGRLVVMSGGHRVDFLRQENVLHTLGMNIPPIDGTVVLASLPYTATQARPAVPAQRVAASSETTAPANAI